VALHGAYLDDQGGGRLLITVSAAGLLTLLGSAPYAVTKHAALAYAEWLRVTYAHRGLTVQALCPQGVRTDMLTRGNDAGSASAALLGEGALEPAEVAAVVAKALTADAMVPELPSWPNIPASTFFGSADGVNPPSPMTSKLPAWRWTLVMLLAPKPSAPVPTRRYTCVPALTGRQHTHRYPNVQPRGYAAIIALGSSTNLRAAPLSKSL